MVKVFAPISSIPFTGDGLDAERFKTPFTVKSLTAVIPPAPLKVRLLTAPVNIDAGSVMAEELLNSKVAPALLASMFPLVLVGAVPDIVNVFDPTVKVPFVNVKAPTKLTFPYRLTPLARFIVKLLSTKEGIFITVPEPPIIILVELPPVTVPVIAVTTPLKVNAFGPMAKLPAISAILLFIVKSPFSVNPFALLIVNPSIVLLTKDPEGMF